LLFSLCADFFLLPLLVGLWLGVTLHGDVHFFSLNEPKRILEAIMLNDGHLTDMKHSTFNTQHNI
jgi:hypothetical protein